MDQDDEKIRPCDKCDDFIYKDKTNSRGTVLRCRNPACEVNEVES